MADIELLIKLSEEDYTEICKCAYPNDILVGELVYQVRNNKPLPKGHGRLIDADYMIIHHEDECYIDTVDMINHMPTVEAIPKDQYEARLKADMAAMLEELKTEIEEMQSREDWCDYATDNCIDRCGVDAIIRLKIHALKENKDDKS